MRPRDPIVLPGQGRTQEQYEYSARACAWCCVGMVACLLAAVIAALA